MRKVPLYMLESRWKDTKHHTTHSEPKTLTPLTPPPQPHPKTLKPLHHKPKTPKHFTSQTLHPYTPKSYTPARLHPKNLHPYTSASKALTCCWAWVQGHLDYANMLESRWKELGKDTRKAGDHQSLHPAP